MVKFILAILLYYTGLTYLAKRLFSVFAGERSLIVLLYHRIHQRNGSLPEMNVSPCMFNLHMQHLSQYYRPISLREYMKPERESFTSGKLKVMVTFDDGWRDNYDHAYPILKNHNIPALIFLTSGYIGTRRLFWQERLLKVLATCQTFKASSPLYQEVRSVLDSLLHSQSFNPNEAMSLNGCNQQTKVKALIETLKSLPIEEVERAVKQIEDSLGIPADGSKTCERALLNWMEIEQMCDGLIEFGSHTCRHALLNMIDPTSMVEEIVGSKEVIEQRLNRRITAFAYPNGNYDDRVIEEVRKAGYEIAFTTELGVNLKKTKLFQLKRIGVDEKFSQNLAGKFSKSVFEFQIVRHIITSYLMG